MTLEGTIYTMAMLVLMVSEEVTFLKLKKICANILIESKSQA